MALNEQESNQLEGQDKEYVSFSQYHEILKNFNEKGEKPKKYMKRKYARLLMKGYLEACHEAVSQSDSDIYFKFTAEPGSLEASDNPKENELVVHTKKDNWKTDEHQEYLGCMVETTISLMLEMDYAKKVPLPYIDTKNLITLKNKNVVDKEKELEIEYIKNPQNKKRGSDLIIYLSIKLLERLRKRKKPFLRVLVIGPDRRGMEDIEVGFRRRTTWWGQPIRGYFKLEKISRRLMPSQEESEEFYTKLSESLVARANEREDDEFKWNLICLCRGGGKDQDLSRLNNEGLCKTIINLPVPICSAIGHAKNGNLYIKRFSDYPLLTTPTDFVNLLAEIVTKAFPMTYRPLQEEMFKNFYTNSIVPEFKTFLKWKFPVETLEISKQCQVRGALIALLAFVLGSLFGLALWFFSNKFLNFFA